MEDPEIEKLKKELVAEVLREMRDQARPDPKRDLSAFAQQTAERRDKQASTGTSAKQEEPVRTFTALPTPAPSQGRGRPPEPARKTTQVEFYCWQGDSSGSRAGKIVLLAQGGFIPD